MAKLNPQIASAIAPVKEGDVSSVIKLPGGCAFYRVDSRKASVVSPFESVKDQIRELLLRQKRAPEYERFVAQLKEDASIQSRGARYWKMKRSTHLTPGEFELLEILWSLGEASVKNVWAKVDPGRGLAYTTVMTVLEKMYRKGFLSQRKQGKAYIYSPIFDRDQALQGVMTHVCEAYFGGSLPPISPASSTGTLPPVPRRRLPRNERAKGRRAAVLSPAGTNTKTSKTTANLHPMDFGGSCDSMESLACQAQS